MAEIRERIEWLKESLREEYDHNRMSLLLHYQRRLDAMIKAEYDNSKYLED